MRYQQSVEFAGDWLTSGHLWLSATADVRLTRMLDKRGRCTLDPQVPRESVLGHSLVLRNPLPDEWQVPATRCWFGVRTKLVRSRTRSGCCGSLRLWWYIVDRLIIISPGTRRVLRANTSCVHRPSSRRWRGLTAFFARSPAGGGGRARGQRPGA
jgi:hypothetical protein